MMKRIRAGTALLLLALLLLAAQGCGAQTPKEATGNSELRREMQQYSDSVKAFQDSCFVQIRAFSDSAQKNDTKAGQLAADSLQTAIDHFNALPVPEACAGIQPFFLAAKEKLDTVYALMIQVLGDGQYDNDDMAYMIALKDVVLMISESCQSGFEQLNKAIAAMG